ncbi:MAG: Asp23/Gls24 family envelope stress response protein [Eubacteriales bacterium]
MEKNLDRNTYVLGDDQTEGIVQIADDVVAIIAGIAATEVTGVAAMAGNITNEILSKAGVKNLAKGVKVEVIDNNVKVDLAVLLEFGYNIPTTSAKIQEKVKAAIENMTGLVVTDVNIRIVGVDMPEEK